MCPLRFPISVYYFSRVFFHCHSIFIPLLSPIWFHEYFNCFVFILIMFYLLLLSLCFFDYYPTFFSTIIHSLLPWLSNLCPWLFHYYLMNCFSFIIFTIPWVFPLLQFFAVLHVGSSLGGRCCSWWPTLCFGPRTSFHVFVCERFDPLRSGLILKALTPKRWAYRIWLWVIFWPCEVRFFEFGIVADPTGAWQRNKRPMFRLRYHGHRIKTTGPWIEKFWNGWSGCPFLGPQPTKTFLLVSTIRRRLSGLSEPQSWKPFSFWRVDDFSAWSIGCTWCFFHYNPMSHEFFHDYPIV